MNKRTRSRLLVFTMALTLTGLGGCFLPIEGPVALFAVQPTSGPSPLAVSFDASGSYDPDGMVVGYAWAFGDGSTGSGAVTEHTYESEEDRTFVAELTVIDEDGNRDRAEVEILVTAPEPSAEAVVRFTWPFHFDADGDDTAHLNDEYFAVENAGDVAVDLTGWSVANERGTTYLFPSGFTLAPGALVFIHSGAGTDSQTDLYWDADAPVWSEPSDIAILYDPTGLIVDLYVYHAC